MKRICTSALLAIFCGQNAYGHAFSDMSLPPEGLHAHMSLAGAWRSHGLVTSAERWNIPGAVMGGEALPFKAGLALDEAFVTPIYRKVNTYAELKFGKHSGSEELELEHALVGHQFDGPVALEAGRMAAVFSPFNGEHTTDTGFSTRRLVYDAIWGGQYNDQGLRLKGEIWNIDLGLELWSGDRFPAAQKDTEKAAADAYARYSMKGESSKLQLGIFHYQATAKGRDDARYAAGHSHSSSLLTTDPTYFDGDISVDGATGLFSWTLDSQWSLGAQGEVSELKQEGRLWDATREAAFENTTRGLWAEMFLRFAADRLNIRAERLKFANDLSGAAAGIIAEKLKLAGWDKDPYRYSASLEHFWDKSFRTRLEWSQDFSTMKKKDIYTLSAVWSEMIVHASGS